MTSMSGAEVKKWCSFEIVMALFLCGVVSFVSGCVTRVTKGVIPLFWRLSKQAWVIISL